MHYLLDTHILIWAITDDAKLKPLIKKEIRDLNNKCYISIGSLWEISIKHSVQKLNLRIPLSDIFSIINKSAIQILDISEKHILAISSLSHHHRDPFDRLIISQAKTESFTIITSDQAFAAYDVNIKWN